MGYSWSASNAVGPNVGGNSSSGNVTVGGNPNVHAAITSVAAAVQNPMTLAIIGVIAVAIVFLIYKRK